MQLGLRDAGPVLNMLHELQVKLMGIAWQLTSSE
jgi:hypothetical protein